MIAQAVEALVKEGILTEDKGHRSIFDSHLDRLTELMQLRTEDTDAIRNNTFVVSINNKVKPWKDFQKIQRDLTDYLGLTPLSVYRRIIRRFSFFEKPSLIQLYVFVFYHKFRHSTAAFVTRDDLPLREDLIYIGIKGSRTDERIIRLRLGSETGEAVFYGRQDSRA